MPLLDRLDDRLADAVGGDLDRQEAVGRLLVKVGGSIALTAAAVVIGLRGGLYFFGDLL